MKNLITRSCTVVTQTIKQAPVYDATSKMIRVDKVIVVKKGMESGNPSLDFQCVDADGNKYAIAMTGNIFRAIAIVADKQFKDGGAPLVTE